jgi:hypothetical protein
MRLLLACTAVVTITYVVILAPFVHMYAAR